MFQFFLPQVKAHLAKRPTPSFFFFVWGVLREGVSGWQDVGQTPVLRMLCSMTAHLIVIHAFASGDRQVMSSSRSPNSVSAVPLPTVAKLSSRGVLSK